MLAQYMTTYRNALRLRNTREAGGKEKEMTNIEVKREWNQ